MGLADASRSWRPPKRIVGSGPYLDGFARTAAPWPGERFPWNVSSIAGIERIDLSAPVTFLAGDNGTGKSTLTELVAQSMGFGEEGGELERYQELPAKPRGVLPAEAMGEPTLVPRLRSTKPRSGYFLRAESFFNVAAFVDSGDKRAPDLALYGDRPLHAQSHGQSFLALAANRFGRDGLFVLDEPEAALSVTGALALLAIIDRAAKSGSQFVIATHSPVLLALPGATIYELTEDGVARRDYDDLDAVRTTRAFLAAPNRFIRAALED